MGLDMNMEYDKEFAQQVIKTFVREGIIIMLPAQPEKRQVLLEYLMEDFEPGRAYTEQEVNFKLLDHYDDYRALRRELVDAGLLIRKKGVYTRGEG